MSGKIKAVKKIPPGKDSADKNLVLQEVQSREAGKYLIRKEKVAPEPRANQDVARLVTRQDDPPKSWYITHV